MSGFERTKKFLFDAMHENITNELMMNVHMIHAHTLKLMTHEEKNLSTHGGMGE